MGRTKPGDYADEWNPPSYTVDERSKVVGGYEPREPNNWGRWGEDDQRGTQNLIGDEERKPRPRGSCARGRSSRWRSRSTPRHRATRRARHRCGIPFMTGSDAVVGSPYGADLPGFQWSDDMLQMPTQGSTQWDGLAQMSPRMM